MLAAPQWWPAQAVKARILLEWGKDQQDDEKLEQSVDAFNATLSLIRMEQAAKIRANEGSSVGNNRAAAENSNVASSSSPTSASTSDDENDEVARELIELHNDRGVALLELDELVEARAAFETTLELCPRHDRALCNLGLVHWAEGRERIALKTFDKAVEANAQNAHSFNNRGALRLEWGDWAESLPDFHRALKIEPFYEVARRNRDQALTELCEPVPMMPVDEDEAPVRLRAGETCARPLPPPRSEARIKTRIDATSPAEPGGDHAARWREAS